jgi:UDP-glucose 4-epimerase
MDEVDIGQSARQRQLGYAAPQMTTLYAITGSSGYIGTRMTRHLLDSDPEARVIGFDVRPPRIESDRLEFHHLDVRDRRLADRLKGRGVRTLLHFAFILDPLYDEREMSDIDLGGTRNVLDAVLAAGIEHVIATSSTSAYGALPDNPVPLREEDPVRAARDFVYAHDKREMDEMLRAFAADHPAVGVCVLRPCIVLGPNVSNYIAATMLSQPIATLLDGRNNPVQFIHEDDLARLIALCVERRARGVFNAVGGGLMDAREAARLQGKRTLKVPLKAARALAWAAWRMRATPFAMPPGLVDFMAYPWVASGEKAARELGFEARHGTRECFEIILNRKETILKSFRAQMKARGKH